MTCPDQVYTVLSRFYYADAMRQECVSQGEELSDDVLTAIERYIYWLDPSGPTWGQTERSLISSLMRARGNRGGSDLSHGLTAAVARIAIGNLRVLILSPQGTLIPLRSL